MNELSIYSFTESAFLRLRDNLRDVILSPRNRDYIAWAEEIIEEINESGQRPALFLGAPYVYEVRSLHTENGAPHYIELTDGDFIWTPT